MKKEVVFDVTHYVDENNTEFIGYTITTDGVQVNFMLDLNASHTFKKAISDILDNHEQAVKEMHERRGRVAAMMQEEN